MPKTIAKLLQHLSAPMVVGAKKSFKSLASTYSATQAHATKSSIYGVSGKYLLKTECSNYLRFTRIATKIHCNFIAICFLLAGFLPCGSAQADTHLFILSGQSNMSRLNPKACFIPTVKNNLADDVIIIKVAQGDTPIVYWARGQSMYNSILDKAAGQLGDVVPDSITFCFMQGESDAYNEAGEKYRRRLKDLIANLRTDLDFPNMGVVIGRLSDFGGYQDWALVIAAQMSVAESDPLVEWINTDDLNDPGNKLHYTDYNGLAGRFAGAALNLIEPGEYEIVVDDSQPAEVYKESGDEDYGCFIDALSLSNHSF